MLDISLLRNNPNPKYTYAFIVLFWDPVDPVDPPDPQMNSQNQDLVDTLEHFVFKVLPVGAQPAYFTMNSTLGDDRDVDIW